MDQTLKQKLQPVLLYGAVTWRTTKDTTKTIQTFINWCLRRILKYNDQMQSATDTYGIVQTKSLLREKSVNVARNG